MSDVCFLFFFFIVEIVVQKVCVVEDGWNSCDLQCVLLVYSFDSVWCNCLIFVCGCEWIVEFFSGKWQCEQEYWLIKEFWVFIGNCIVVCFVYEWYDDLGNWFCFYGNENWVFDEQGLMYECYVSINDLLICEDQWLFCWLLGCWLDNYLLFGEFGF